MSLDSASSAVTYTSVSSDLNGPSSWGGYTDEDSIDYPDEPEDGDKDDDEDPEEDPSEEHEPEDDDDDDDTYDEDTKHTEDEEEEEHPAPTDSSVVDPIPSTGDTEVFETDESAPTPRSPQTMVPFSQTRLRRAWKTVRLEPPISASMEARIAEHDAAPIPPTSHAYD
ncbi:hypothetical protein Tco_0875620 [Tanacetum coccineum]|uniref:Uncharacterized protein n=1 Tax=Tanacetum coccineum TaxID=301880 RepID=A0ABQ5BVM4_9ASTR